MTERLVTANMSLSLDGRYHGPGGPADFGAFIPYVTSDVARDHMTRMWSDATTAVLGRVNAEGFIGYWSAVAVDDDADPRDRAYAQWLVGADKVVFSRTLTEAPWERTRLVNAPVPETVAALKSSGSGDIFVNTSPSIIKPLLAADLIDRLYLMVFPEIVGGGERLFEDGLPRGSWRPAHQEAGALGELALIYDRVR
ncbi:riboflavin biosynthesis protein RibD [Kribbella sandramycini]|uniref:Dihydrofolate reductase n=1 Tax=Kribbella sandramycini TaxID=60450 RepID=A0A7Y4NXX7_9ACTN|nr:dihydrofolate reductase family protein [Kribbella sandramycini]MBB6568178.1 dihydrofolate reductase [Kribbella sandramycini]NOL39228.1 riboflavin biosynthesis protein RibD [Kribbella sandramycini]